MRQGPSVLLEGAEATFEPAESPGGPPQLCLRHGALQICAPVELDSLARLKGELEKALKRRH